MFWYRYFNKKSSKLEAGAASLDPGKNPGLRNRGFGQRGLGTSPGLKFRRRIKSEYKNKKFTFYIETNNKHVSNPMIKINCGENLKTGAEAMAMQHITYTSLYHKNK
ncbi:hypothetical protein BpHYR1_054589 [Brachionus plicatilis]|uniref:Uncharacterized protein n=1 Tax=Brachionus plicatilis TaxID=10195 RepID=A0A3M7QVM6_BRAPC|nr:hypothetical protein BpHYR1_054589 [Brachionus plicatilis]